MQEFPQALGTYAEGFLGPSQWEPQLAYVPDFGPGPDEATEGIRAQGAPPDYPAAQAYAACLIAQRCLEEAGADDRVAVARGVRLGLCDVLRAVPYRSCNGPAGRPRGGPRGVAAREEAGGPAAPRVRGQAPVPGAAMDRCQWECEPEGGLAWKPCRSTT
jgi:hypothetical protein